MANGHEGGRRRHSVRLAAFAAVALALLAPQAAGAAPGKVAVGVREGASVETVASLAAGVTGGAVDQGLEALDAFVVTVPDVEPPPRIWRPFPASSTSSPFTKTPSARVPAERPARLLPVVSELDPRVRFLGCPPRPRPPIRVAVIDSGYRRRTTRSSQGAHPR